MKKHKLNCETFLVFRMMGLFIFFLIGFFNTSVWAQVQLQQGEEIVHTQDGCGQIVKFDYLKPESRQRLIDSISKSTWTGVCADGLALGAGKAIVWDASGKQLLFTDQWMLYGRKIGRSTIVTRRDVLVPDVNKPWLELIQWDGEFYSHSVGASGHVQVDKLDSSGISVGYKLKTGEAANFVIYPACYNEEKKKNQPCIMKSHNGSSLIKHFCKPKECEKMWQELADPIIKDFDAFEVAHAAEIEAVKKSVGPIITQLLVKREQEIKLNKVREQRKVQRQQQLTQANQARKPVESPSLDQLIKQTLAVSGARK